MKKIFPWTLCLLMMLGIFASCEKEVKSTKEYTATLESSIDATVASLVGSIISPLTPEDVTDQYFLLSEDKSVPDAGSVKIPGVKDSQNKARFTGEVTDFKFGSIYYYKAVVVADGKAHAGNVRSFRYEEIPITSLSFEKDLFYYRTHKTVTLSLYVKISPENATYRKQLSFSSSLPSVANINAQTGDVTTKSWGTTVITATESHSGKKATCKFKVMDTPPSGATDLGLSVYWGDLNLGATGDFEAGNYYAYGETTPKTSFSESGYKFPTYVNGVLPKANDPAQAKGGHWRMPTAAECEELIKNCKVTLGRSSSGRHYAKVKSKINGYEIWIPLGGYYSIMYGGILEDDNVYFSIYTGDGNHLYNHMINDSSKPGDEMSIYCNGFGGGAYGRNVRPVTD